MCAYECIMFEEKNERRREEEEEKKKREREQRQKSLSFSCMYARIIALIMYS